MVVSFVTVLCSDVWEHCLHCKSCFNFCSTFFYYCYFISFTESLKQAVGHEAIKLLVNVDEDDYEAGRLKLLQNLQE